MKKSFVLLVMLVFIVLDINADAVEIDGIYYNLVSKVKVAEVTNNPNKYNGKVEIPGTVKHEGITYNVTGIGNSAFSLCSGLTSITIPNSVTTIGNNAFGQCSGLTSVTIPNSVTFIGDYAFQYCIGLTSVTIPNSVTSISKCTFQYCSSLVSVTIPNSVTSIGNGAFYYCRNLTSISIPNSVTSIGGGAFKGCSSLTTITIPYGVTSIEGLFYGCSSLTSVLIPNSVISIYNYAFYGCSNLTSITIPNSVTTIGNSAFDSCSGLTSITIPNSVTSIGDRAFESCNKLTSITIPNNVTSIGDRAFSECKSLSSITIGSGVSSIKSLAFASCPEISDVYCYAENVPNTSSDAFEGSYIDYVTLHVPAASVDDYKAAEPWKNFKSIVDLDGNVPETQKCATPVIIYENGKLMFACATEGVEYVTDITCTDIKKHYSSAIDLTGTYTISVYATKAGYDNSDVATKEIQITGSSEGSGKRGDLNNDGEVNAADAVTLVNIIMNNP